MRFLLIGYDRVHAREEDYEYDRCAACGLVAMQPLPRPEDIPGLYPEDYEAHVPQAEKNRDKWINRQAIKHYYGVESAGRSPLLRTVFRLASGRVMKGILEPHGSNRLLDIGCGTGSLLARYRSLGWHVQGVEPNAAACALCRTRGLEVHEGTVFDAPFRRGAYDVVLANHVLEHVLDPVAFVRRAAGLLAPGGRLIAVTPNSRGIGLAMYGSCWFPLEAPRHLMLFSPQTARLLGDKAGVVTHRINTLSEPRRLCESRHYAETQGRTLPPGLQRRAEILAASARAEKPYKAYRKLMTPLTALCALFGRGDIMRVEYRLSA
jgi:2-polyprenyl-3-methyl-5-hydroxy-6-metoxy-1,4-benzoquinol methylase